MGKKKASDAMVRGYIVHAPKIVRKIVDPVIKGHSKRSTKGKQSLKKILRGKGKI